ncbi:MAG: flagellar biosynthesis protein FlgD [Erythrobacteraceae bacterium]|nr:flagellar biosynthesis protein FlgD [Erythrobacteraceae bacterium]|tara:strand:+ start:317 stop:625 length:309 start_codon:yes stop_codon:yes gene_type:complete
MSSTVNPYASAGSATNKTPQTQGRGMDQLGQTDFLRLLTVQLSQQDPFEPVDNKEMLAQMAQFSSLAGTAETNETLGKIVEKLDALIAAQSTAGGSPAANDV